MWHEARKQEKRIRGLIVDYRKRAERRQNFYEKIQADPTQFIQVHGRRCKIHLDPAVGAAGDGTAIIVPWQGHEDNLIDRFDVRAHLDFIPPITKSTETDEDLSNEERQCNYERYRILAQNDFLNVSEEKFLHQLYLEEQYGANAQLESVSSASKKKQKTGGATIGYSYEDTDSTSGPQPFSHLMQASTQLAAKTEKDSDDSDETDSDIDMDVSIDITKIDTTQAHELNSCGRNYGMLSNDFYSYLTKDADEADALRLAREEEQEKMLLSGRKSRRERRAQKERRILARPFSPPSYAAKEDATKKEKEEESDSRSPSPADGHTEKITYITSFGGEEELQPHSKITISLPKVTNTLGEACAGASASMKQTSYAQKSKDVLEKTQKPNEASRSRHRSRSKNRRYNSRSRSRSRHRHRRYRRSRSKSRSRSYDRRFHRRQRHYQRHRSTSSSSSRSASSRHRRRSTSKSTNSSHHSLHRRSRQQRSRDRPTRRPSRSRSSSLTARTRKTTPPVSIEIAKPAEVAVATTAVPMISYPLQTRVTIATSAPIVTAQAAEKIEELKAVEDLPPPPLKRYYGRKRDKGSSSEGSNETDSDDGNMKTDSIEERNVEQMDVDTTSERSNPLPSTSTASLFGKQTGKYSAQAKNPSFSHTSESKATTSAGSGGSLNLRERLKRKMQNLLNRQYKADKQAEIEKTERERQIQQEREDEMRELALKLRRRQRELRHKCGTPTTSKGSDSEQSDIAKRRSKSRSVEHHVSEKRQKSPRRSRERDRDRERERERERERDRERERERDKERERIREKERKRRTRSRSRNRRSASRRRRRSPSSGRLRRQRSISPERSSRYDRSDYKRQSYRHRPDERDKDRNRDRERERDRERRDRPKESSTTTTENNRNRVVISAPPKLKKLVDY